MKITLTVERNQANTNRKTRLLLAPVRLLCRSVRIGIGLWAGVVFGVLGFFAWLLSFERASDKLFNKMLEWQEWMEA